MLQFSVVYVSHSVATLFIHLFIYLFGGNRGGFQTEFASRDSLVGVSAPPGGVPAEEVGADGVCRWKSQVEVW